MVILTKLSPWWEAAERPSEVLDLPPLAIRHCPPSSYMVSRTGQDPESHDNHMSKFQLKKQNIYQPENQEDSYSGDSQSTGMTGLWSGQEVSDINTDFTPGKEGEGKKAKAVLWGRGQLGQGQQWADSGAQD